MAKKIGLFGEVGWDITPDSVKAELDKQKEVSILIDSGGGEVFAGLTIYNLLKSHPFPVHVEIVGMAGSIASVIALGGDSISISETAKFFIHNALTPMTGGNAEDLRDQADTLEMISDTIRGVYEGKTKLGDDKLKQLMAEETILSAQEALDLGFVDQIINPVAIAAKYNSINMKTIKDLKIVARAIGERLGLKNESGEEIPDSIKEQIEEEIEEAVKEGVERAEEEETELEALSDMVPRAEFEAYKAEVLALLKPVLDAMDLVPSTEEMQDHVNAQTTSKIKNVLQAMKAKTTIPSSTNDFAPVIEEETGRLKHGFLQEKQNELRNKNGR